MNSNNSPSSLAMKAARERLETLLIETVRLAIVRHSLYDFCGFNEMTEDRAKEIAQDTAWAMQGEGTCDETPAASWQAALDCSGIEELRQHSTESDVIRQLEKIAKAIRALEGMPVDFRLARKLSEVLKLIQEVCEP